MRKFYLPFIALLLVAAGASVDIYKLLLKNESLVESGEEENKVEYSKQWRAYELSMTKDPATGMVPENMRIKELQNVSHIAARTQNLNTYLSGGPQNIGGRTRCAQYDVRYNGTSNRVLLAGGVNGGIFKSTDGGQSWSWRATQDINSVTSIVQDPRSGTNTITGRPYQDTWYAGTGEFEPSSFAPGAFVVGYGLFVSDDNGDTWRPMNFSRSGSLTVFDNTYDMINRLAVSPTTGELFIARYGDIIRATRIQPDSFQRKRVLSPASLSGLNSSTQINDIVISSTGRVYAAFSGENSLFPVGYGSDFEGVWESPNGDSATWFKIADNGLFSGWKAAGTYGRVVIGLAPSNEKLLFALYDNLATSGREADLVKIDMTTPGAYVYTNLSSGIAATDQSGRAFQVQGGYDLAISIKPDDPNTIVIGGTNALRSTNGFTSSAGQTNIGGYGLTGSGQNFYDVTHPDIHWFTWRPGSNTEMLMSNDGGMQITTNIAAASVTWTSLNTTYQTAQYYWVTIDPTTGDNTFLGGAQDNNTTYRNGLTGAPNNHSLILVGDGMSVGISTPQAGTKYLFVSSYNGSIRRLTADATTNAVTSGQTGIQPTGSTSEFKTLFHLNPDNTNQLWFVGLNKLYRTVNAYTTSTTVSSANTNNWQQMTGYNTTIPDTIRSLATTRGTYANTHNLFIGTTAGKVYRVKDPANATNTSTSIYTKIFDLGAYATVSDIAVNPRNDDTVMVVLSNYNVTSIWMTGNANAATPTWTAVEGNVIDPSVRSCKIVNKSTGIEYYVGTSVGLYSTTSLNGASTVWVKEGAGTPLEYAIINSLAYRPSDNTLLVGTHGNGMWYVNIGFVTGVGDPVLNDKNFIVNTYPKVTRDNLLYQTGTLTGIRSIELQVTDMMGRRVWQSKRSFQLGNIPVSNLAAGTYVLTIWSDNKKYKYVTQFIKQ